jgi:hypothetical protein
MTKATPLSDGIAWKNLRIASNPPADAPMPTMHGAGLAVALARVLALAGRLELRLGTGVTDKKTS